VSATAPPAFLQLAGHPLRWQLLGELARSDRRVHELTELVGEPQNLVSYHLGKLREGRLVSARRSSADRRDAYYTVDLASLRSALVATGSAVHPGLCLAAAPIDRSPERGTAPRVLFLCTGNSARSQIAEALTHLRSGGLVEARSAGSHPKPLHPLAVRVMRDEYGVDLEGRESKHLDVFADEHFDRVISLCDRVREVCPDLPGDPECVHWSMADPSADHDEDDGASDAAFRRTASEIDARIDFLVAALVGGTEPNPTRGKDTP
jgi:protein-tyrosine-phosphatase